MSKFQRGQTGILILALIAIAAISGLLYFNNYFKQPEPVAENKEEIKYAWTQYGPDDSFIARVITSADSCPPIKVNGSETPMDLRAGKDSNVEVATCEKTLPKDTASISVGPINLPVANFHPKKILVIGDTGCRLKGKEDQNCDSAADWVLPGLSKKAADVNFDLIIHVGDYLYRESQCPEGDGGCSGSPWGYNWKTVESDFFAPAKPLLARAPWLMVRGNHEICTRAGALWFRFQDSYPYPEGCPVQTSSYTVNFENLQLLYIDTSAFSDFKVDKARVDQTKKHLAGLNLKDNFWLITHRPIWGIKVWNKGGSGEFDEEEAETPEAGRDPLKYKNGKEPTQDLVKFNDTLESSFEKKYLDKAGLSLSGHYHNLEALSFKGVLPPQLIVGNTATELESKIDVPLKGLMMQKTEITDAKFVNGYGYMIMEEVGENSWKGAEYSSEGKVLFECDIKNREVVCN